MKQVYCEKWSETVDASHSKYVFSDKIPPGHMLHVHNCFAWAPDREQNDLVRIGVRNGGVDVLVRVRASRLDNYGLSAYNGFFVGEGDQVYAYFPDADNTDTIELHVIGILMTLDEWREGGGR